MKRTRDLCPEERTPLDELSDRFWAGVGHVEKQRFAPSRPQYWYECEPAEFLRWRPIVNVPCEKLKEEDRCVYVDEAFSQGVRPIDLEVDPVKWRLSEEDLTGLGYDEEAKRKFLYWTCSLSYKLRPWTRKGMDFWDLQPLAQDILLSTVNHALNQHGLPPVNGRVMTLRLAQLKLIWHWQMQDMMRIFEPRHLTGQNSNTPTDSCQ
ncbi:hypothetical protein M011DRAFT_488958 [Sporormia fimetaria CBS 119925]|uniref:Uncharacterized protein n=1 Tax=Sporormia fimetaria CBS 119925 TaxID=1340428 RepID=A0A6A6V3C4_9PLEO|nr:hypothetical protein M011DRAFT_488958 [Sporormia fimetaria CBS 119925]